MRRFPLPVSALRLAATVLLAGMCIPSALPAQSAMPTLLEWVAPFATKRLKESSGVAVSRQHPGVLWTHNDSGSDPTVYAVDMGGNLLGRLLLVGAGAVDWEDIALGPCPERAEVPCLYVADTGDNDERRRDVGLYITPEPDDYHGQMRAVARHVALRYPDRPRDVEAVAVRRSGEVLMVTKGRSGSIELYRIGAAALRADTAAVERWTRLDIVPQRMLGRLVTGAAVGSDDGLLAVRTYTQIFFFRLEEYPGAVTLQASCWLGASEPQGEAIDFLNDSTLVLTTEGSKGRPAGLSQVRCPMTGEEPQP